MLKRLLGLMESSSFEALDAQAFVRLCQEEPEQAKKYLWRAYRGLVEEYEQVLEPLQQKVQGAVDRLRKASSSLLEYELHQFYREELVMRRVCMRLKLAQEETQVLLAEWHDWLRHSHGGMKMTDLIRERMELLRSELTVRGVSIKLPVFVQHAVEEVDTRGRRQSVEEVSSPQNTSALDLLKQKGLVRVREESIPVNEYIETELQDEFDIWRRRVQERKQEQKDYWGGLFQALDEQAQDDPKQAMMVVKMYRKAHE